MSAIASTQLLVRYSAPNDWSVDRILEVHHVPDNAMIVVYRLGRPSGLGRQHQTRAAAFHKSDNTMMWDKPLHLDVALAERDQG